jgi:rRNA-processing protein FCF1
MNNRTIVLDTNILLISIPSKYPYRPIFDGLLENKYDLAITNEILSEYYEIISQKTTPDIANST